MKEWHHSFQNGRNMKLGKKQKRKEGNTRLPTFGGCYCQQKSKKWEETNIKEMEKNDTLFGWSR